MENIWFGRHEHGWRGPEPFLKISTGVALTNAAAQTHAAVSRIRQHHHLHVNMKWHIVSGNLFATLGGCKVSVLVLVVRQ